MFFKTNTHFDQDFFAKIVLGRSSLYCWGSNQLREGAWAAAPIPWGAKEPKGAQRQRQIVQSLCCFLQLSTVLLRYLCLPPRLRQPHDHGGGVDVRRELPVTGVSHHRHWSKHGGWTRQRQGSGPAAAKAAAEAGGRPPAARPHDLASQRQHGWHHGHVRLQPEGQWRTVN